MIEIEVLSVRSLPLCKIQLDADSTIGDVKKAVEKCKPRLKVCRQSIREEAKGKDMRDNVVLSTANVVNGSQLYVKDLGPQISWSCVFIAEYFGPLVVYGLFALQPEIIYGANKGIMSKAALIAWGCWSVHYCKRLLETVFVHRFSHGTMPLRNLFKNCGYYWGFSAFVAYHVNHPLFTAPSDTQVLFGLAVFTLCEIGNFSVHILLRNLRPAGTTVRKIPVPDGNPFTLLFNYVSCPNYTYEYGAWLGFTALTNCFPALVFAAAGMYQMTVWAIGKHRNYKSEFADYPRKRKAIVPFII